MCCHFALVLVNFHQWSNSCHELILDWFFVHSHSSTQTLCTEQGCVWFALAPVKLLPWWFSTFSSVQAGRQQMRVRWQEIVWIVHNLPLMVKQCSFHVKIFYQLCLVYELRFLQNLSFLIIYAIPCNTYFVKHNYWV